MKICQKLMRLLTIMLFSALLSGIVFGVVRSSEPDATETPISSTKDIVGVHPMESASTVMSNALNPNPPSEGVKLVFIHHSVGDNWLDDGKGDLGDTLGENHYYVSDTYYDWGPADVDVGSGTIGDHTDIGHWYNWFVGPHRDAYLNALYTTTYQHADYTRPMADPGGENEIIMFKSCYPNSSLRGDPDEPPTTGDNPLRGQPASSSHHTVGHAKGIYKDLLEYFETRQDKLFIVITAPPRLSETYAANARAFNNWLVNDWLAGYPYHNVAVFDFYNVLTTNGGDADTNDYGWSTGNHHRLVTTTTPITIEHITNGDDDASLNILEYPTKDGTDEHPSPAGNQKATGEFVPLLNAYYNCWKHGDCWDDAADWISVVAATDVAIAYPGDTVTYTLSVSASQDFAQPVTLTLQGAPLDATIFFVPNPVTPPGTSQLSITTTTSTATGSYPITITGSSGSLVDTTSLTLIVGSAAPSFTLAISPTTRVARPGQVVSYTVDVNGLDGFNQPVTLQVIGLRGIGITWSANPVTPDDDSILALSIPGSSPPGTRPFYVVGTWGTQANVGRAELVIGYPYKSYIPAILKNG